MKIGSSAFQGCTSLKEIDIPNSVDIIGNSSFTGCTSLQSINIPNSVTEIGENTFAHCTCLENIELPDSVKTIPAGSFSGCKSIKSVDIPNSVIEIGLNAFADCLSLESVDIPNSVTIISESAFRNCRSLKNIIIPSSVISIGKFAFHHSSIRIINIPINVHEIGEHALCNCPICNITVENGNPVFFTIDDILYKKKIEGKNSLIKYVPKKEDKRFCVDENTEMLESCAFKGAKELEEIVLHEGIFSLGNEQTFASCTSLKQIILPSSIKKIPKYAFFDCTSLQDVILPNSENYSIGEAIFKYCNSLKSVHSPTEKIDKIIFDEKAFDGFDIDECTLYIPSGTRWAYRHHPGFGKFKNIELEKKN